MKGRTHESREEPNRLDTSDEPDRVSLLSAQGFVASPGMAPLQLSLTGSFYPSDGNRPVRTRTRGGVGAGGENPPATRLYDFFF